MYVTCPLLFLFRQAIQRQGHACDLPPAVFRQAIQRQGHACDLPPADFLLFTFFLFIYGFHVDEYQWATCGKGVSSGMQAIQRWGRAHGLPPAVC